MFAVVAGSSPSVTACAFATDTVGVASSSVRVIEASVTVTPEALPSRLMVSSSSSRASSVGVRVKVALALCAPTAMVSLRSFTWL